MADITGTAGNDKLTGTAADAFGDGFLAIEVVGGDTVIRFDSDGGGDGFVTLATLTGVTNVTANDLLVPPADPFS